MGRLESKERRVTGAFLALRAPPDRRERRVSQEHLAPSVLEGLLACPDPLAPKEPKEPQARLDPRERRACRALQDTRAPRAR